MPLDPSIPLQVRQPAPPDVLGQVGQMMQLKNAMAQQALIPGQQQLQQMQIQSGQNDLNEYQGFKDALAKHNGDFEAATPDIMAAAPKMGTNFIKTLTENKEKIAQTNLANANALKANLESGEKKNALIWQTLQRVKNAPPEQQPTEYQNGLATLHAAGIDTSKAPQFTPEAIDGWMQQSMTLQQTIDQQKLKLEQNKDKREQAAADAKLPGEQATSQQGQLTQASQGLGAAKSQPDWDAVYQKLTPELQQRFGPQYSPAAAQRATELALNPEQRLTALQNGALNTAAPDDYDKLLQKVTAGNPKAYAQFAPQVAFYAQQGNQSGARKVITEASAQVGEVNKETDPKVLGARTAQAVATAKALRSGDNPALSDVPPAAVAPATAAATKLDLDYGKAKASADAVQAVLDMAAAGNKAAGANASLVGVGAVNAVNGIKRMNSAEIAQYGTAGSLLDKIQGKLQGWTEGQPIPKDVLSDMKAFHQALRSSSYQQYTDGLKSVNSRYGSKFGPTATDPNAGGGLSATHTLNGRPIALDPKNNQQWIYTDATGGVAK